MLYICISVQYSVHHCPSLSILSNTLNYLKYLITLITLKRLSVLYRHPAVDNLWITRPVTMKGRGRGTGSGELWCRLFRSQKGKTKKILLKKEAVKVGTE
jgi:hypothetical protein